MLHNNYEIRVLVKGRPVNEFYHNGQNFIEGRDGSNFEIEFINKTALRVEAVLSVDGLSVTDGKDAGPDSTGYLVEAYGSVKIPGWKLTAEQVAAFVFAGKKKSYAAQSTGSSRNTGVIGAMVFVEKPKPQHIYQPYTSLVGHNPFRGLNGSSDASGGYVSATLSGWGDAMNNAQPVFGSTATIMNMSASPQQVSYTSGGSARSMSRSAPKMKGVQITASAAAEPKVEQTLGTGFGEATDFATTKVEFERGDMSAVLVIYYDDARGLRARGIELSRRKAAVPATQPQAFPGLDTGCTPPPGWKG